jgi:hypothetical protein
MRLRRRWAVLAVVVLPLLENCVGDDPATTGGDDASVSDGGSDATTTSDASPNDATANSDSGTDAAPADPCKGENSGCPGLVNPSHLALWLRADTQLDCVGGHVATWRDLSGNGRDVSAATYPDGGAAALPECGVDTLKGHNVVSFTKPTETSQPILAETMAVDLGFMANASFTVMMVVKPTFASQTVPLGLISADRTSAGTVICSGNGAYNNGALDFTLGAFTDGGSVNGTYDQNANCPVYSVFGAYPRPSYVVTYVFDTTKGHSFDIAENISFVGDGGTLDLTPVADLGLRPGFIGREANSDYDRRFQGDIAEIVVYDVALTSEIAGLDDYFDIRWNNP